ncbi:hypothetical protein [Bartonella sp. HY761]|uniref:hypothetical protein n=1 Tax=Bartonella sp. HY761 TaxID=2979330 RepID=UPI00220FD4CD|nr:hypothetical protein [Bartonella sp. HY761]UXN05282.1 hypothetical protein N6A79_08090 [Bartonella sp. HY761]
MSWKTELQIQDLEPDTKLEMSCKKCGHIYFLKPSDIMVNSDNRFLYLDEVETKAQCKSRGCTGEIRMMLVGTRKASPFQGGLA